MLLWILSSILDQIEALGVLRNVLPTHFSDAWLGLLALNTTYIAPYGTPVGQVALVLLLGAYAGALVWMQVMTRERPTPRFLPNPDEANSDRSPSSAKDVSRATPVGVG